MLPADIAMEDLSLDKLGLSSEMLMYGLGAIVALVVLVVLWRTLRSRKEPSQKPVPNLTLEVMSLGSGGPPAAAPVLEFYNIPVRLAAIILAPAGRVRELPPPSELNPVLDAVVPGLGKVVEAHKAVIRRWPSQLSARGFAHALFAHVRLPGDGGKGTPWSSVAGVVKIAGQPVMAGLVLRAAGPNAFGQIVFENEGQWLGCLRVKERKG